MASIDIEKLKENAAKAKEKAKQTVSRMKRQKEEPYIVMPEPTGDVVVDSYADLDAVQQAFRSDIKRENRRFELATDSEYWFCACFQTRAQKEAFLQAIDIIAHGDKYIDGRILAEKMGIKLKDEKVPYLAEGKIDKSYLEFVD